MTYVVVALIAMGGLIALLAAGLLTLEKRLLKVSEDVAYTKAVAGYASSCANVSPSAAERSATAASEVANSLFAGKGSALSGLTPPPSIGT